MKLIPYITAVSLFNALIVIVITLSQSVYRTPTLSPSNLYETPVPIVATPPSPSPSAQPAQAAPPAQQRTQPTPIVAAATPVPATPAPTTAPAPQPGCLVVISGVSYDLAAFRAKHSGGDIFQCGTDMTDIFFSQHNASYIQKLAPYKL